MKETHGLIVKKIEHAFTNDEMSVRIYDGNDFVGIHFSTKEYNPKLTYEETLHLAQELRKAAARLKARVQ